MGEAGPAGPGRRPHRRSRSPHNLVLAQTTSSKKKRCFFLIFSDLRRSRMAPATSRVAVVAVTWRAAGLRH